MAAWIRLRRDHSFSGRHLSDALDGTLTPRQRALLARHVDECPECGPLLQSLIRLRAATSRGRRRPPRSVGGARRAPGPVPSNRIRDAHRFQPSPPAVTRADAARTPAATWQAQRRASRTIPMNAGVSRPADEAALVARAQAGDRLAFEALVRLHADRLFAVVSRLVDDRHEAEEATQEAFLRAWRAIARFNGESLFFTWLYRIGVNEAHRLTARRATRGPVASLDEPGNVPVDPRPGPAERAQQHDLRVALEAAVRALDVRYRAPLILRDIEGLSTSEAAAAMGLGEAAFKSRLHRARLLVREAVEDHLPEVRSR
ncbi:MAG: hypothetical protein NVS3B18_06930 [Candidatus Dormibacteria bacterium]